MKDPKKIIKSRKEITELTKLLDNLIKISLKRRKSEIIYWKHITLVFATIISFSTIIFSQSIVAPHLFIRLALFLMVMGLMLGLLLIQGCTWLIYRNSESKLIQDYNSTIIKEWKKKGEITNRDELKLIQANLYWDSFPRKKVGDEYETLYKLYEENRNYLPWLGVATEHKKDVFKKWIKHYLTKYIRLLINVFYLNILLSLIMFLLGLLAQKT